MDVDIRDIIPDASYDWRGLSIKQPAASLIADGFKRVENRKRGQFKHASLEHKWVLIHSSISSVETNDSIQQYPADIPGAYRHPDTLPKGKVLAIARIRGVYDKQDLSDDMKPWGHDGDDCIEFDVMIRLDEPVDVPGDLSFWKLKMDPHWQPPKKKTGREARMNSHELETWRLKQEEKYHQKKFSRRGGLFKVLLAINENRFDVMYNM